MLNTNNKFSNIRYNNGRNFSAFTARVILGDKTSVLDFENRFDNLS